MILARHYGACPDCGGSVRPGDPIRTGDAGWQHDTCPDDVDLTPSHPVCQTCWLAHPEGACDR